MEYPRYFYIISNDEWDNHNIYKFGVSSDLNHRLNKTDQHLFKNKIINVYEIEYDKSIYKTLQMKEPDNILSRRCKNPYELRKMMDMYKLSHLDKIVKYLPVEGDGGIEFIYRDGLTILEIILREDFIKFGLKLTQVDNQIIKYLNNKSFKDNKSLEDDIIIEISCLKAIKLRDYQISAIHLLLPIYKYEVNPRAYLYLPTGGGKTSISYMILKLINPDVIIFLSPRIIINNQNIGNKYISILGDIDKKIIISECLQNYKNIYKRIREEGLRNIFIIFDESHWGLDKWINDDMNEYKKFLLRDNEVIKYRLYTSASPNTEVVNKNKDIYGSIIEPIKFSELIEAKWLCPIKVHIFEIEISKEDTNYIEIVLEQFNRLNKHSGFSFHNTCLSAYKLFQEHLKLYELKKTDIKPYLLINKQEIKKFGLKQELSNIDKFNKDNRVIGYVVSMYNMGYDNKNIDIIYFSDNKNSYEDIIQTIGRGTRSDGKMEDGRNLEKELDLIIPTNHNNDMEQSYENIKEVLRYLIKDIGLDYNEFIIHSNEELKSRNKLSCQMKYPFEDRDKLNLIVDIIEYDMDKIVEGYWNLERINKHCRRRNIHTFDNYINYHNKNRELLLPEPVELFDKYNEFKFIDTYMDDEIKTFTTKKECIRIINEYLYEISELEFYEDKMDFIKTRINIPEEQNNLYHFYGGDEKDFI